MKGFPISLVTKNVEIHRGILPNNNIRSDNVLQL